MRMLRRGLNLGPERCRGIPSRALGPRGHARCFSQNPLSRACAAPRGGIRRRCWGPRCPFSFAFCLSSGSVWSPLGLPAQRSFWLPPHLGKAKKACVICPARLPPFPVPSFQLSKPPQASLCHPDLVAAPPLTLFPPPPHIFSPWQHIVYGTAGCLS